MNADPFEMEVIESGPPRSSARKRSIALTKHRRSSAFAFIGVHRRGPPFA
jgi:hypothetical protein